jgi:hypothetical protein
MPDTCIQQFMCVNMLMALCQPEADPNVSSCGVDLCSHPSADRTQVRINLAKDTDELGEVFAWGLSL